MTEQEIKIVTRTCITCLHEPEWKGVGPFSSTRTGRCTGNFDIDWMRIHLTGQIARYQDKPILDCPCWEAKRLLAAESTSPT